MHAVAMTLQRMRGGHLAMHTSVIPHCTQACCHGYAYHPVLMHHVTEVGDDAAVKVCISMTADAPPIMPLYIVCFAGSTHVACKQHLTLLVQSDSRN